MKATRLITWHDSLVAACGRSLPKASTISMCVKGATTIWLISNIHPHDVLPVTNQSSNNATVSTAALLVNYAEIVSAVNAMAV